MISRCCILYTKTIFMHSGNYEWVQSVGSLLLVVSGAVLCMMSVWGLKVPARKNKKLVLSKYEILCVLLVMTAAAILYLWDMTGVLVPLLLITTVSYRSRKNILVTQRRTRATNHYLLGLKMLSRQLASGRSVYEAIRNIADSGPATNIWCKINNMLASGATIEESFKPLVAKNSSATFPGAETLRGSLGELMYRGADLAPLVHSLEQHASRSQQILLRQRTLAAQGRMQAKVLAGLPLLLLPVLLAMEPRYKQFYLQTPQGILVLSICTLMVLGAQEWMNRRLGGRTV